MGSREQALIRESPNGETHFQRSVISDRRSEATPIAGYRLLITDTKYLFLEFIGE